MKRFDWEDFAVIGTILFASSVVLMILGCFEFTLLYWWIGAWISSIVVFIVALYVKNKE